MIRIILLGAALGGAAAWRKTGDRQVAIGGGLAGALIMDGLLRQMKLKPEPAMNIRQIETALVL